MPQIHEQASAAPDAVGPGGCFLCAYADVACGVGWVEGTLRGAVERWRGGRSPVVVLATAKAGTVAVVLNERDRPLARALAGLPTEQQHRLRLRIYHLHRRPEATADQATDQATDQAATAGAPTAPPARYPTLRTSPASAVVVEPDLLLNITDINNAEYCVRQYVLRRMVPSPPTAATLRGTIVHGAFKELLKGRQSEPRALLNQALQAQTTELAMHQLAPADVAADAEPHLSALVTWYERQRQTLWQSTPQIRVETFLLAPAIGLKGRLDALWQDEHTSQLLELKTSTVRGELPRREHRWQVYGYQALLASRRQGSRELPKRATLLYSGTPGQAEAHGLEFNLRELHRVLELRNLLALAHLTESVPAPPGEHKCGRCSIRANCLRASSLLGWQAPPLDEQPLSDDPASVADFRRYYDLLAIEGRATEEQGRLLWTTTAAERRAAGIAIDGLAEQLPPRLTERGEWEYTFTCANTSELREGDMVLLSDGDPIAGAAVTGTLLAVSDRSVTVWTPEKVERPALIDRYGSDMVHDRTVHNLWRWLDVAPRMRALVRGDLAPNFASDIDTSALAPTFNPEQRTAVERALAARDYLLIQGPPGTGKTRVVAEITRQLVARGQRVLLAAFTNQAVDNVLTCLLEEGFDDFVRLGHEMSVLPALRTYRLSAQTVRTSSAAANTHAAAAVAAEPEPAQLRAALQRAPVVASTTATWAAERFDAGGQVLAFDVAIVDEASQLTVPAVLGALRFAQRFILVGDECQLPPLVVSGAAAEQGLGRSLFASLSARWGEAASVRLTRQYRMHPTICDFASAEFYGGQLTTVGDARTRLLAGAATPADGLDEVLDPRHPLVLVDVPTLQAPGDEPVRSSQDQARITSRLVLGLRTRGIAAERIGVIAPFRAQVAAIRKQLASAGEREVTVDTVDRFQGGEREVILLSFGQALGNAHGGASTLSAATFIADPHRLNVALTRAQRKLIVVGDRHMLAGEPQLARLEAYIARLYGGKGGIIAARLGRSEPGAGSAV